MAEATRIIPFKKQIEAKRIADTKTFTLYGGAIRGGKSYWLLLCLLSNCFKYDKSRWLVVRESLPTLRRTILITFQRLLDEGFQRYVKEFNQQTMTVTFTNGSQIIFLAESFDTDKELNRFRGLEINGAGLDEINELQEATLNKVIERSGSWTGSPSCPIQILATCNPSGGWVKSRIYDKWKDNTLPPTWAYIPAKISDNPHIPKDYIESLKANMPPHEYDVFVNGNWEVDLNGSLFKRTDFNYFDSLPEGAPESVLGYVDIADEGSDYLCAVFAKIYGNQIYITDAIFTQDTIDITCPMVAAKIKELNADYTRIEGNNQGSGFIRLLRQSVQEDKVLMVKNTQNKHTRILMSYHLLKNKFLYVKPENQSDEYRAMMQQIYEYKKDGKSKHDDAPDAMAGLAKFIQVFLPHVLE
jgi:predicted phage terminase large subunit-like protein